MTVCGDHPCSSIHLSVSDFCENQLNDNHALLKGMNEFLLILAIFLDWFRWNLVEKASV